MKIAFTPNDRGQVGIGTLIVFIAMVLVAAIAAGVLINTAGFLQTQAEDTGTESTEQVANNLNVINEIGVVNDTGSGEGQVNQLGIGVQPAAGAGDLNLEELSLQYVADESFSNLVHAKTIAADGDGEVVGEDTVFNTIPVTAEDGEDNVMTDSADRYDIVVPLADDRPFIKSALIDEGDIGGFDDETRQYAFDVVIRADDEGVGASPIENQAQLATRLNDVIQDDNVEIEPADFTEVEINAEDAVNVDADLFENDGPEDFSLRGESETGLITYLPGDTEEIEEYERYVVYEDQVNAESLNVFDSDRGDSGTLSPAMIDDVSNENLDELVEGEEVELTYTTETGAQTVSILQVPDSLAGEDDDDAVDL